MSETDGNGTENQQSPKVLYGVVVMLGIDGSIVVSTLQPPNAQRLPHPIEVIALSAALSEHARLALQAGAPRPIVQPVAGRILDRKDRN